MMRAGRKGAILVLVMFVLVILTMVSVSLAFRAGLQSRTAGEALVRTRLRSHATSALAIAVFRLTQNTNDFDHPAEPWCTHEPLASEGWVPDWGQAGRAAAYVTDYQVVDEEGKLNVLTASEEVLKKLGMTDEQVASLMDWMDPDDIPRAGGAESDYYLGLATPYRCKNAPIEILEELLLIRGFGPKGFYGEHPERYRIPGPDGRIPEIGSSLTRPGWVDLLTCMGDGRIDINTAPEAVLRALPLTEEAIGQIIGYRGYGTASVDNLEEHAFRSFEDIDQLQGLTDADRSVLHQLARFRSDHFRVFVQSRHLKSGMRYELEALVRMNGQKAEFLQWKVKE